MRESLTPLRWAEVPECDPAEFTVFTVPKRFAEIGDPHASMDSAPGSLETLLALAARDEADGLGDAPWPPHFRKVESEGPRVAPSRAKAPRRNRAAKMPLIIVANSPDKDAALAGLERWKARHAEAAALLAVEDVLVDSMRGRSSTWTRVRINLRHVPEDRDHRRKLLTPMTIPTREWRSERERDPQEEEPAKRDSQRPGEKLRQVPAAEPPRVERRCNRAAFCRSPAAKLRRVTEAGSLHMIVGDFDHQFGPQRLP